MKELLKELGFEHLPMMSEFVLKASKIHKSDMGYVGIITKFCADFITQPLTKGMFIPCSEDGEVLEEPKNYDKWVRREQNTPYNANLFLYEQYQQAKDRVLFEGAYIGEYNMVNGKNGSTLIAHNKQEIMIDVRTIEQAINNGVKLILI